MQEKDSRSQTKSTAPDTEPVTPDSPKRKWFRFSLRVLMGFFVLSCIAFCGFWMGIVEPIKHEWRTLDRIEAEGIGGIEGNGVALTGIPLGLSKLIFDQGRSEHISSVFVNGSCTKEQVALLENFSYLQTIWIINNKGIDDAFYDVLPKLSTLENVYVVDESIHFPDRCPGTSADQIRKIANLSSLRKVGFYFTGNTFPGCIGAGNESHPDLWRLGTQLPTNVDYGYTGGYFNLQSGEVTELGKILSDLEKNFPELEPSREIYELSIEKATDDDIEKLIDLITNRFPHNTIVGGKIVEVPNWPHRLNISFDLDKTTDSAIAKLLDYPGHLQIYPTDYSFDSETDRIVCEDEWYDEVVNFQNHTGPFWRRTKAIPKSNPDPELLQMVIKHWGQLATHIQVRGTANGSQIKLTVKPRKFLNRFAVTESTTVSIRGNADIFKSEAWNQLPELENVMTAQIGAANSHNSHVGVPVGAAKVLQLTPGINSVMWGYDAPMTSADFDAICNCESLKRIELFDKRAGPVHQPGFSVNTFKKLTQRLDLTSIQIKDENLSKSHLKPVASCDQLDWLSINRFHWSPTQDTVDRTYPGMSLTEFIEMLSLPESVEE